MPRQPRNKLRERRKAEKAYETALRKDEVLVTPANGDVRYLEPADEDEVLSTSERLRAREPQPVTRYRICETCGGDGRRDMYRDGGWVRLVKCTTCDGEGRVPIDGPSVTREEEDLVKDVAA